MELIRIENQNGKQVVSARELYTFLDVGDHFTQWIVRMLEYGFEKNTDYQATKIFVTCQNGIGGVNKTDYLLTMDCAKEIAMIQRSDKGKQARKYFIECEKRLMSKPIMDFSNPMFVVELAQKWADATMKLEKANEKIEQDNPKVIFSDAITGSKTSIQVSVLAKLICQNGVEIGGTRMFEWLRENNYLMSEIKRKNQPYQKYMDLGYFEIKESCYYKPDNTRHICFTTMVTGKGQQYFINKFLQENTLKLK